jgi:hypothetical protein
MGGFENHRSRGSLKEIVMKKFNLILLLLALVILATNAVGYNVYYGQLHSHTNLSDGYGSPEKAYKYARDTAGLDFFSIADHCSYPYESGGLSEAKYQDMISIADSYNEDGTYVTFWGFEWTSDSTAWGGPDTLLGKGHITVINSPDHCEAIDEATNDLNELVEWLSDRDAIAFFNHPGQYGTTFDYFNFDYTDKFVGMELWNRNSDYYGSGTWYHNTMDKGWYIGASGSQDNHDLNWGTLNEWRMAILAPALTREDLLDAMKARRFYSSRDNNLVLSFTCNGYQMGSVIEAGTDLSVVIEASDGDSEIFSQIDLLENETVIETWTPNSTNPILSTTVNGDPADYFYVRVYQGGGWQAISSPIFIISGPDVTAPTPDPMTWAMKPYATSESSIAMEASVADDDLHGILYYFTCVAGGGHDSGWQADTLYEDTGLTRGTQYTYTVTARDTSVNQNVTGVSSEESATTIDNDIVIITKAEYSVNKSELKVEATSSDGGSVVLTVVGYGDMTYKASTDTHKYSDKPVADPGGTVIVTSSGGGQDSKTVEYTK